MDTAQLIQSVRDGDYPQVATAVAIPAGHRALTVTPVTTTSHDVILRSWTQVLPWHWEAIEAAQLLEDDLILCQGRSTDGATAFMLRTEAAQLMFCLWAAHRNPTHPQVPALLEALSADPASPIGR